MVSKTDYSVSHHPRYPMDFPLLLCSFLFRQSSPKHSRFCVIPFCNKIANVTIIMCNNKIKQ